MSVPLRAPRRAAALAFALALVVVLGTAAPATAAEPSNSVRVPKAREGAAILVTYRDGASTERGGAHSARAKSTSVLETLNVKVFKAPRGQEQQAMRELAADRGVVAIESDVVVTATATPNDPLWPSYQKWAHDKVTLRGGWDMTRGSSGAVIAILDSGLELWHPEFAGRILPGYDYIGGDTNPNDPRGHGTMSGGAAAARGNNSAGVAGGCWECRILPVRVLDRYGRGYASNVIKGIVWATNRGADVINMSFGGFSPTTAMDNAVQYAREHGVVVVASAGNEGNTSKFYPAAYRGVISVAASDPSDRPYSWSTRGSWVKLAAPGCFWSTRTGKSYGNFCGTSASAPLVAGIVGLMWSANPNASRRDIEWALLGTATPLSYVMHGKPNATAAIKRIKSAEPVAPEPAPEPAPATTTHAWVESGGQVVIEAERANRRIARNGKSWIDGTIKTGYAGRGYVAAWEDTGFWRDTNYTTTSAELRYLVKFTTPGVYTVWTRTWAPDGNGDSYHIGINGIALAGTNRITTGLHGYWAWTRTTMDGHAAVIRINNPGVHTINAWIREDGFRFDRLVITQGAIPIGKGPGESSTIQVPLP